MRPSASGRSSWFVMNMEIVRSRSGFRNKVPGGFIEVHGFRNPSKNPVAPFSSLWCIHGHKFYLWTIIFIHGQEFLFREKELLKSTML